MRYPPVVARGGANDTGSTHDIPTRFGDVKKTYGIYRGHYQDVVFEGPLDAVFWVVGQRLNSTSHCYEHTFVVNHVEMIQKGEAWNRYFHAKATCAWTSYVGD